MHLKIFITSILLTVFLAGHVQSALPNVSSDGKPFPSLAPMIKEVHPAVVNISTFSKQQHGPYHIVGMCSGARISAENVRQMGKQYLDIGYFARSPHSPFCKSIA